jgi:hypothetical protein
MKRIMAATLAAVIAVWLLGCTAKADGPKNTPESIAEVTIKPSLAPTEEPSPSQNVEPISDATIQINEDSSMSITVSIVDGKTEGGVSCLFDGADAMTEFEYILAAGNYFKELGLTNYYIMGASDGDVILLMVVNGARRPPSELPSKYDRLETNNGRILEYAKAIAAALSED